MASQDALASFGKQNYLNLETFRKSGEGVKTPVWFAESQGKFYVRTVAGSGKVKRLRRNPRVRIAPCTASGDLKGAWVEANAREIITEDESRFVNDLLNRKYGLVKRLFDLQGKLSRAKMTSIEISLSDPAS